MLLREEPHRPLRMPYLVARLPRSIGIPGRSLLDGQHAIAIPLRGEARVLQSFRYFVGNIPAGG